ncbi:DDE superfamily endonuclease, CENP-B-like protein [Purpureocillium lavendulum]|uniref:DDE superfamily endonuclease, CENP-B-like protein n=1 Tax=Purpureocillium lavendulum TaxID=1247861 RepID=A0AB34FFZ8_9HYPO|nr:DDE superfamily endonuclease, CENP-B-like protein [Purpureocillium lavendulum]
MIRPDYTRNHYWMRRWNTLVMNPIRTWMPSQPKIARISEGLSNNYMEVIVREYVDTHASDHLDHISGCPRTSDNRTVGNMAISLADLKTAEEEKDTWLPVYLATFILLHNISLMIAHDATRASGSSFSPTCAEDMGAYFYEANTLLAYFHYYSRSFSPLHEHCNDLTLGRTLGLCDYRIKFIRYSRAFAKQHERDLIAYIHKLSSRGIPPTLSMIKNFAQDIAKTEVGKDWPYRFVQRYRDELGCTWFDGLDMSRKRADNASRYKAYFELIRTKIEKYNILPCNTYNVDEKGFLLGVINRTKRVFALSVKKQGKLLGAAQDGNRSWITFLACVCQDLSALPPFLIYQGKPGQVQDTWLTEFDPEHQSAFFTTSETGWTSHQLGKEWLTGVFDRFTKAKARNGRDYRLLITDGHSSHVNMDFLEWCDQHRIIVAVFPPHSTHRLQPLDVSLFSPLSTAYSNQLIQWTAKTQGLVGLSEREFWTLFWNAFEASFTPENVASGWKRTGLLPFDPEVVLSQIIEKGEDDSDTGGDSAESLALQQPSARDLRRLVDKVADKSAADADRNSRRLKSTLESLQSEVELLRYENRGLRETIIHERQRRQRGKALKDYLFDRTDPNSAQVFSPAKVAQARLRKAALESQKKEEALQKETQKVQRQQKAAERRALTLERRRQREAEMERKRQMKEARQQEKETNRRVRQELKRHCQETAQEMQDERQVASETRKKSPGVQDEIIVASQPTPEPPVASQAPDLLHDNTKEKSSTAPIRASPSGHDGLTTVKWDETYFTAVFSI